MSDITVREIQLVDEVKRLKQELEDAQKRIKGLEAWSQAVYEGGMARVKEVEAMLQEIVDAWYGPADFSPDDYEKLLDKAREMLK
jgi:flagellin-specific chaperone FliS